jgi:glycosyltransferase involved in cell wall biosynthesis
VTVRFGFVSTFPPTQCGLATFTESLRDALVRPGSDQAVVVRLLDGPEPRPAEHVVAQWVGGEGPDLQRSLDRLNAGDVAVVQHEFGVYGGPDGEDVLLLLAGLRVPSIVILHTVLTRPTPHQRQVLEAVLAAADAVVVMTETARERLVSTYAVDVERLSVIAHGAHDSTPSPLAMPMFRSGRPTILTWGLLGPGKGLEWGIDAMAGLRDLTPMPRYIIAGQTHPKVLLHEGERYRESLVRRVKDRGLTDAVTFNGHYLDAEALDRMVREADIVLLPYDSTDQVTSGVLSEAVAAGKPVVATAFPHAQELLGTGAGLLVAHRDPDAIGAALRTLLGRRDLGASMVHAAAAALPIASWSAIADQYRLLADRLLRDCVPA